MEAILAANTGEEPTILDLALCQRDRLRGLAHLCDLARQHEGAFGDNGDGIIQLLRDAVKAANELIERIDAEGARND